MFSYLGRRRTEVTRRRPKQKFVMSAKIRRVSKNLLSQQKRLVITQLKMLLSYQKCLWRWLIKRCRV